MIGNVLKVQDACKRDEMELPALDELNLLEVMREILTRSEKKRQGRGESRGTEDEEGKEGTANNRSLSIIEDATSMVDETRKLEIARQIRSTPPRKQTSK